ENEIVIYGDFKLLKTCKDIFAYERNYGAQRMLVLCSFTENEVAFRAPKDFDLSSAELVLSNYDSNPLIHNGFLTRPYETRVYLMK
ncbi:MAG: alpha-glucosidase C-terminal domain-containing protein, partial [Oscillospiraceae bacterium]|nr:alpha-glucosidase C-terminal domain-containing protein [Oscillospiraceae bacterium]